MGLFTLFTYLKTKESHDRWITRRVWEFRQQISKAKYPKISQKYRSEMSGRFRRTPLHCTERKTLQVSVIRRSGYVYPEKSKRPPSHPAIGYPDVKCRCTERPPFPSDVRYPDEKCWRTELVKITPG